MTAKQWTRDAMWSPFLDEIKLDEALGSVAWIQTWACFVCQDGLGGWPPKVPSSLKGSDPEWGQQKNERQHVKGEQNGLVKHMYLAETK